MKTDIEEPSRRHKSRALLGIAGLMLSTGIVPVLVENPPLSISQLKGHKISAHLPPIHVMFSMLNTVNFYLNLLLLLLHAMALHRVQGAPIRVFLMKHLPAAAQTVSFSTLVLSAPLFVHAAVSKESISFAIGAILVCVSLIAILSSIFQQLIISASFVLALLALCISSGFLLSADPFLYFFNENHHDPLTNHLPIHLLLLSIVSFVTLTLSLALVILRTGAPSATRAENFIIVALSVAIAVLLVGGYMAAYVTVTDIGTVVVEAGEL